MDNYNDKVKFNQQKDVMKLIITNNFKTPEELLEFLIKFCKEVTALFVQRVPEHSGDERFAINS